jgi:hypothetical protein
MEVMTVRQIKWAPHTHMWCMLVFRFKFFPSCGVGVSKRVMPKTWHVRKDGLRYSV